MGVPALRIEPDPELVLSKYFLMAHKMNTWTANCLSNYLGAGLHPSLNPAWRRGIVVRNSRTHRFNGIAQGSFGSSWLRGHLVSSIAWTDTTCVLPLYNCLSDSVVESVNTAVTDKLHSSWKWWTSTQVDLCVHTRAGWMLDAEWLLMVPSQVRCLLKLEIDSRIPESFCRGPYLLIQRKTVDT